VKADKALQQMLFPSSALSESRQSIAADAVSFIVAVLPLFPSF
jgi:hypothetical protein